MPEIAELIFSEKDRTGEAFADAMLYAQAVQVRSYRRHAQEILTPAELLEDATNAGCEYSTRLAASYLNSKYKELFSTIILLKAHCEPRGELVNDWTMHQVLLVQAKDGTYFSASPANYDKDDQINRLTNTIKTDSLDGVLTKIKQQDGGTWPTSAFITDTLKKEKMKMPENPFSTRPDCTRIYADSDKNSGTFTQIAERKPLPPLETIPSL